MRIQESVTQAAERAYSQATGEYHERIEAAIAAAFSALASDPAVIERTTEALWVENERWHRRNPELSKQAIYPYEGLIDPTKEDLRTYARAALRACLGIEEEG